MFRESADLSLARDDDYFFGVLHSVSTRFGRCAWARLREATAAAATPPPPPSRPSPSPGRPGRSRRAIRACEAIAEAARALVAQRDAWLHPAGASEADLKKRTLTNLYNARPTWLDLAHRRLDAAVLDAYGWPRDLGDEAILERLLELNLKRRSNG